jgi:hypothetical protein
MSQEFDPEADSPELRTQYSSLLANVKANRHEFLQASSNALGQVIDQSSTLYSGVKNPQMATVDASLLTLSADISTQRLNCMSKVGAAFGLNEWLAKIRSAFQVGSPSEEALGRLVAAFSLHAPTIYSLKAMEKLPSEQGTEANSTVRRQSKRATIPEQEEPQFANEQAASQQERMTENETTVMILKTFERLSQVAPIALFQFVINPRSFGQSVENLFWTSFLVREEKARLCRGEQGELILGIAKEQSIEDAEAEAVEKHQLVCEFDMQKWNEQIARYSITESIIPHRK